MVGGDGLCHPIAEEHAAVDKVWTRPIHSDIAEVDKTRTAEQLRATCRHTTSGSECS